MLVRRYDPFHDLTGFANLAGQLDRVLGGALAGRDQSEGSDNQSASTWAPPMDVVKNDTEIRIRAELPGLSEEEVEITVENNRLSLKGEKKLENEENAGHYRRLESRYGSFHRTFGLPNLVDQDAIDANFRNGVLEIVLPKVEAAQPKKIAVKVN